MSEGSVSYHEPYDVLSDDCRDMHRALVSLVEELEAVDWYQQRADACSDNRLEQVLLHNRDEEIEHAMMILEWICRRDTSFDKLMRKYLHSEGSIAEAENEQEQADGSSPSGRTLGIGRPRGRIE